MKFFQKLYKSKLILTSLVKKLMPLSEIEQFIFIVGAQKAGSTSLHAFLTQHPKISEGKSKELTFFHKDSEYAKGLRYYRTLFPMFMDDQIALDSTPENLYVRTAPQRIHEFSPNAKIVIVLRDPISRALSAYNMYKQLAGDQRFVDYLQTSNEVAKLFFLPIAKGEVEPTIDYFLNYELTLINSSSIEEEPAIIRRGIYAPQIQRYIDFFGSDNVLILFSEDLKKNTQKTVNRVFDFVDLEQVEGIDYAPKHVRQYTNDISGKDRIKEVAGLFFEKDKGDLLDQFNIDVPW